MPITRTPSITPKRLEVFTIGGLVGGWNDSTNQDELNDKEISDGRNVIITDSSTIEPRGGNVLRGNFLGSTTKILGMHELVTSAGTRKLICVYDTDAFVLSTDWEAAGLTITTNKPAEFTNYLDRAYMTNKGNTAAGALGVTYYDGTTWTQVTGFPVASAASGDTVAGLCSYKERLIGWNTTNFPKRVYYSNANLHTIGSLGYFDVDEAVTVCVPFFDYLLIFTENYVYRIGSFIFTGAAFEPNDVQPLATKNGCIALRSAKQIGHFVYYLARAGVYRTNGAVVENLTDKKISNYLASTVSKAVIANSSAGMEGNRYHLALSTNGTTQDEIITFDILRNAWQPRRTNVKFSCFANFTETGIVKLYGGSDTEGTTFQLNSTNIYDDYADQEQIAGRDTDDTVNANAATRMAQGFRLSTGGYVTAVAVFMKKNTGTTTGLTVRIETDNAGVPSGTLVLNASTTITTFTTTGYRYKMATFSTPPLLNSSTTYWIVVQHTTEATGDSQYHWGSDASSPAYATYNAAAYASAAWTASTGKDMLFRVYTEQGYEKYFVTKGYNLGNPQYLKIVKRVFAELETEGAYNALVGLNTDAHTTFTENALALAGNNPIRGSTLTRGSFTRGTTAKVSQVMKFGNARGRRVKLRVYNNTAGNNFAFHSAVLNYRIKLVPR